MSDAGLSCLEGLWGVTVLFGLSGLAGVRQRWFWGVSIEFGELGTGLGCQGQIRDIGGGFASAGPDLRWQHQI